MVVYHIFTFSVYLVPATGERIAGYTRGQYEGDAEYESDDWLHGVKKCNRSEEDKLQKEDHAALPLLCWKWNPNTRTFMFL